MRRVFKSDDTEFFNADTVPDKYKNELDAILENVESIHGKKYGQHVKFVLNMKALLGLILTNSRIKENVNEEAFKNIMTDVAAEITGSHAEACGLTAEQGKSAFKTVDAMEGIIKQLEKEVNNKRRGQ